MIPILLQAHTRPLTKVIYNKDGDLLFTAAKDSTPSVFYSHNGERLGTFKGHIGSVWALAVTSDSRTLVTGSGDNSMIFWDVETGKINRKCEDFKAAVRALSWSSNDRQLAVITDAMMKEKSKVLIYDVNDLEHPIRTIVFEEDSEKATALAWTETDENIVVTHQNGSISLWEISSGKQICLQEKAHTDVIRDLQMSKDRTYFITASRDTDAKLFDSKDLRLLKTYRTGRPVNSASISPIRPEVCIGGGQEALQVTTTSSRAGQFEARFFHEVFENEIGRAKGHFGPINTLTYSPDGSGYASGAEDGYVRVHKFDADYFEFKNKLDGDLDGQNLILH